MAYGTFGNSIVNHYNKTTYSIGRDSYTVHIFKTDSATEKVAPAVYVNENLQLLKNMNANGIDKSRTIAKINGNVMGGNAGFFGWMGNFISKERNAQPVLMVMGLEISLHSA